MGNFRHILNGIEISEPRNWDELEITKDFTKENDDVNINISELEFAGEVAKKIRDRAMNGLNGGVGIFENEPYQISVGQQGNSNYVFDGYLDFSDGVEFIGCNEVSVPLKKRKGSDWLNDVADGFSFRYLYDIGTINNSDFVKSPYIINYVPDGMQLMLLGVSIFVMTKELIESIKNVAESLADVIKAATPIVGVGVGLGAVAVTAWDIGYFILITLKLVAYIAYTIAMVIAIKNLFEQLLEQLMPKKRYHLGMRLYRLFEVGCQHLGLTFKSDLLSQVNEWILIPQKNHRGGEKPKGFKGNWTEVGVPSANDPWDTFGDLIRVWKQVFNADYKIVNGEFQFERKDYCSGTGNFTIGDYFTDQEELKDVFNPNTDEIISNYNINWAYDAQDQNTLDNQSGRVFQAITEPKIVNNKDMVSLKNLQQINIPCSQGLEKRSLTDIEEVLKSLAKLVDKVTGIFGGGTNYASKIESRKGSLLLSSHFLTKPKLVVMNGSKLAKNQRDKTSAKMLWNKFHFINSFAEINGHHNQYLKFNEVKVPFCMEDFISLIETNEVKTSDGKQAKIELLKWNVWNNYATINYRVKEKYTDNLKIKYLE